MKHEMFKSLQRSITANFEGGLRTQNIIKKNLPNRPLITIITAVLNNEKYFEDCFLYKFIFFEFFVKQSTIRYIPQK